MCTREGSRQKKMKRRERKQKEDKARRKIEDVHKNGKWGNC